MDWERLEAEFADVDADLGVGSRLADRILAVVRARRARRAVLAVVAGAMLAAGLVVSVLLVVLPDRALTGPGAVAGTPDTATRAHIYAAALRGLTGVAAALSDGTSNGAALSGGGSPQRSVQQVWVSTRLCNVAPTSPAASSCPGGYIPRGVQRQLRALLGRRVRFAAAPRPSADAPVVRFGRLVVHGERARLGIEIRCGPLCGVGRTLLLRKEAGHWTLHE